MLDGAIVSGRAIEGLEFTPGMRQALQAVPVRLPGWSVEFDRCDEGDEYASITRTAETRAVAMVVPRASGAAEIEEGARDVSIGTAADPEALIALLGTWLASPRRRG